MTDNEIIKALECCSTSYDCEDCPYYCGDKDCPESVIKDALDLINRKNVEIEKCKRDASLTNFVIGENIQWHIDKAKSEAIKEFAEKAMDKFKGSGICNYACAKDKIRKTLKEMRF